MPTPFLICILRFTKKIDRKKHKFGSIFFYNAEKLNNFLIVFTAGSETKEVTMQEAWLGFRGGRWQEEINVRDFIQKNYTPYDGDKSFLQGPTEATNKLWAELQDLQKKEIAKGGVLDMDTDVVSTLTSHPAGYIADETKDLEKIVGLQTDKPLKRAFMPFGGIKMAEESCKNYGYTPSAELHRIFTEFHKTHNQGVFDAYTPDMRMARKAHIITGLPDTYGRGRIVGDYRRVALYGVDYLIEQKKADKALSDKKDMTEHVVREREELAEQIKALEGMKAMAKIYGYDISKPATNAHEAVQWLYFGYLAAIKTQNGAAMSVGRVSTFIDIYMTRDLQNGTLTEIEAQEIIDHFVMKLRMVKFARITSYNELFSGDPVWATLEVAGLGQDGRHQVTKNDYRFLHTLVNMGPSPEPNLTILYSPRLPYNFKKFAAEISVKTSAIQYENDDTMRPIWGDDYSICCCVSATQTGKEMQFFGARANLAKALLYAINGGKDECLVKGQQVGPEYPPISSEYLDYDEVVHKFELYMDWLAHLYVNTLNLIHYMHDKYYYEAAEMALIDTDVRRTFATGIAGFSHVVDSLSAIKYAKVKVIRDPATGLAEDFQIVGDFPRYGNDDISLFGSSRHSWARSSRLRPTAILKLPRVFLPSRVTSFTVRQPVLFRTAARLANRSLLVQARATVLKRTVSSHRSTLWQSSRTNTPWTASAIRRRSTRTPSATTTKNVPTSSCRCSTATSARAATT